MLSQSEIDQVQEQLRDLLTLVDKYCDEHEEGEKQAMLIKLFLAKPSSHMTEIGAASRAESYMMALEDIPAWAISDAIRKWHRGEVSGVSEDDLKWTPDSAVLRRISMDVLSPYRDRITEIERVLAAKPLQEVLINEAV